MENLQASRTDLVHFLPVNDALRWRVVRDYAEIERRVQAFRALGLPGFKIVLTAGTFDLFHVGHSRYLAQARNHGDVLIVGVDADDKVRKTKGPTRPIVLEDERLEIVCHCRYADMVFLKRADDAKWQLIKSVRPDVLIATIDTYSESEKLALREYCGEVVVLERQAETSTTARVRQLLIETTNGVHERLKDAMAALGSLNDFVEELRKNGR